MALKGIKKWLKKDDSDIITEEGVTEEFYTTRVEDVKNDKTGGKMILLEPRAYSESQQIADYLKKRNTVVVNLKRVTPEQAKRIVDFLSGTIFLNTVKNPYVFKHNGRLVRIGFADTNITADECLTNVLKNLYR